MIVELNPEEIRQILHGEQTNPEIPERIVQDVRRFLLEDDGSSPPDDDLPVWYRDFGAGSEKTPEMSTDGIDPYYEGIFINHRQLMAEVYREAAVRKVRPDELVRRFVRAELERTRERPYPFDVIQKGIEKFKREQGIR